MFIHAPYHLIGHITYFVPAVLIYDPLICGMFDGPCFQILLGLPQSDGLHSLLRPLCLYVVNFGKNRFFFFYAGLFLLCQFIKG